MATIDDTGHSTTIGSYFKANLREYGLLFALIAVMATFQIMTGGILMKPLNITNLVLQNSYIVIMAIGMLLVIVSGNIDLSVGSVVGFIGALAAVLMVSLEIHFIPTAIICLVTGALIGAAQGYWVAYHKIPSFIVTLAGMLVFRGLTLALLQGRRQRGRDVPADQAQEVRRHAGTPTRTAGSLAGAGRTPISRVGIRCVARGPVRTATAEITQAPAVNSATWVQFSTAPSRRTPAMVGVKPARAKPNCVPIAIPDSRTRVGKYSAYVAGHTAFGIE